MQILPEPYASMTDAEAVPRIGEVRRRLGAEVLILGHHYQRDEVIAFADVTGDSYGLARAAATRPTRAGSSSAASISWPRRRTSSPRRGSACSFPI
jgi:quinolinate synthase